MKKKQTIKTKTVNLIKPQVCHSKYSPDAWGVTSARAPEKDRRAWAGAHITLSCFDTGEFNQWWTIFSTLQQL